MIEIFKNTTKEEANKTEELANLTGKLNSADKDDSIENEKYQEEARGMGINLEMPEPTAGESKKAKATHIDGKNQFGDAYEALINELEALQEKKLLGHLSEEDDKRFNEIEKIIENKYIPQIDDINERYLMN